MVMDWITVKETGRFRGPRMGEVLPPGIYECVFCKGQGKTLLHNRVFRCRVCKGEGTIAMKQPSVRCAFCGGRGKAELGRDLPCIVCKGTGLVPVKGEELVICPDCKGKVKIRGKKLPCMTCKGAGVIPKEQAEKILQKQGAGERGEGWYSGGAGGSFITGSEVEALEKLADLGGRAHSQMIARAMGRNTSYARIICRGLGKGDYIDFSASGVAEITAKGIELLRKKGLLTEERIKKMKEKFGPKEEEEKEEEEGKELKDGWKMIDKSKAKVPAKGAFEWKF